LKNPILFYNSYYVYLPNGIATKAPPIITMRNLITKANN
jgi:hypothetical protein